MTVESWFYSQQAQYNSLFWNIQTASEASQAIRLFDTVDSSPGIKADWT
jgi:hypothetical protein